MELNLAWKSETELVKLQELVVCFALRQTVTRTNQVECCEILDNREDNFSASLNLKK